MMTAEAKVITIPVKKYTWGNTVYWTGCPSRVKKWVMIKKQKESIGIDIMPYPQSPRGHTVLLSDMALLAVTFKSRNGNRHTKELPIQMWNTAIQEKLINSDKNCLVTYELVNRSRYEIQKLELLPDFLQEEFNKIFDLTPYLQQHTNKEMVRQSCLKFLMES